MTQKHTPPDILVKDSKGNVYYAPGSSVQKLDLPHDHPLHAKFQGTPGEHALIGLAGRIEGHAFILEDGQGANVGKGGLGLPAPKLKL